MKTAKERAEKIYKDLYSAEWIDAPDEDNVKHVESIIEEARNEAYDAALADAVRTLKHCGSVNAAKLIQALAEDRKAIREKGQKTKFPALRDAVPLPA